MRLLTWIPVGRKWAVGAMVLVLLALIVGAVIVTGHGAPTSVGHLTVKGPIPRSATTPSPSGRGSLAAEQKSELEQSINRIRAVHPVGPAASARYAAVSAEARQQPDLYAAAFVSQLLTQDYRTDREQLLAWAAIK